MQLSGINIGSTSAPSTKPKFIIPVLHGTNSEYDTARAIEKSGGEPEILVIQNLNPASFAKSITAFNNALGSAQGLVLPGGYSGGDEPDGCGNFMAAFLGNPDLTDALNELIQKRGGLVCGIGSGFMALLKLGLLPYGELRRMTKTSPALTHNAIGRHQSMLVRTRVVSNKSPWLSHLEPGGIYLAPVSYSSGRFIAEESLIKELAENGQIAAQYVDLEGNPSGDIRYNPAGSAHAIEGITSLDGRIIGRMAHSERCEEGLFVNVPGNKEMNIFAGAVNYFRIV